jgi:hypothetical protein
MHSERRITYNKRNKVERQIQQRIKQEKKAGEKEA